MYGIVLPFDAIIGVKIFQTFSEMENLYAIEKIKSL
jgi:hypothetical protein